MTTLQAQPATRLEDFRRILLAYQQATERLKDSHDLLMAEVSRLRSELAAKDQQLERRKRLAALGEMAAGVAHEIRNPLGSIQLYADLLVRQLGDDANKCELAGKIGTAVRGLDAVVSDMLTFTRIIEADRRPVAFAPLVAEAAGDAAARIESAGARLRTDGLAPGLVVELDSRLFRRVLVNLMINAADALAGQPGPRELIVQAETFSPPVTCDRGISPAPKGSDSPARWRITVADTGPGIAAEVLDKLFQPFFTTKHYGTGLGLAIVHHIVVAHGGTITAANRPGGGAAFTILLP